MISHSHRCIFIHIPKTAGTSIEQKLGHFDELQWGVQDHTPISQLRPYSLRTFLNKAARRTLSGESPARVWQEYRHQPLTEGQYRDYFKFAFVRNPWYRVLSWYQNVMRDERIRRNTGLRNRGRWREVPADCTLKQFLVEFESSWALKPQLHWLKDSRGHVAMDFIGKFENLANDFAYVCEKLAIRNCSLPRVLFSERSGEVAEFDQEVVDLVYRRYEEEILLFGYEFE